MASLPPTIFCPNTSLASFTSFTPFFTKKIISKKPLVGTKAKQAFVCKATNPSGLPPVPAPDLATCRPSEIPYGCTTLNCCPPKPTRIINFKPDSGPIRTRVAAQNVANDAKHLENYERAVKLMRALPEDDPRSWAQQANVHCAYCNGAYTMPGCSNQEIQIHNCWLFFPWHRLYLYFHEKILGKLIGDPTFALPFWNWDAPAGMQMPSIYTDTSSPLYDQYRNQAHLPPKLVDLNYCPKHPDDHTDDCTRIKKNLITMYQQMISQSTSPRLFFGEPYGFGDRPNPGPGSIEKIPHNSVHNWTGDPTTQPNKGEDMGQMYSAARDPIFYAHHSNVDRMWSIYKELLKGSDLTDPGWLDSEFLFYDENKDLVRVKVRDSLDESKLGYKYQEVEIPWLNSKPTARKSKNKRKADISAAKLSSKFPAMLSENISVEVPRPSATKRTPAEKAKEDEVLVISGIEFDGNEPLMFDVHVNDDKDVLSGKDKAEFAGSFVNVPRLGKQKIKTNLRLGITNLLADLEAEEDATVVVTLVPKCGIRPIIGGLKIELMSTT